MLLKQVGLTYGDKHLLGKIPNMKFGEYRYYPRDNPNLQRFKGSFLRRSILIKLLNKHFPKYVLDPNLDSCFVESYKKYYAGSIGTLINIKGDDLYMAVVKNKGYICFKEASPTKMGTVIYIHGDVAYIFKELYVEGDESEE